MSGHLIEHGQLSGDAGYPIGRRPRSHFSGSDPRRMEYLLHQIGCAQPIHIHVHLLQHGRILTHTVDESIVLFQRSRWDVDLFVVIRTFVHEE